MNVQSIVLTYCAAWSQPEEAARGALLERCWSETGLYCDPMAEARGREALNQHIGEFQRRMPGAAIALTSGVDQHHGKLHFTWAIHASESPAVFEGRDFGEIDADGMIAKIVGFFAPRPVKAA